MELRHGQRVQLRFSTRKHLVEGPDGKIESPHPERGTVTGFRRGQFRVSYDSVERRTGQPRSRFWYNDDQVTSFEFLGGAK